MRKFFLWVSILAVVAAAIMIVGGHAQQALISLPVVAGGIVGYFRGEGTEAFEQRGSEINTERAKTSALSRWRQS